MIKPGKVPSLACGSLRSIAVLTLLLLGFLAAPATAQPTGGLAAGVFEIDGNLLSEDPTRVDWLAGAFGPTAGVIDPDSCKGRFNLVPNFLDAAFYRDDHWASGAIDLSTFSSSKNNDCIAPGAAPWSLTTGSGPAKSDITETYSASYVDPVNGDNWLLLAFATRTTNGDSEMDFEFNSAGLKVSPDGTQISGLGPDCGRTIGDFIVSINFVGGGTLPQPMILTWDGTTYVPLNITPPPGQQPRFLVAVNNTPVPAPCGAVSPDGSLTNQYVTRQFAEIAINLTQSGVDLVDYCGKPQSTLGFKTRSSAGFTSAMKDVKLFKFHLVPSTESTIAGPTSLCAHSTTTLVGPDPANAPSPISYLWSTGETTRSITLVADDLGVGSHPVWLRVQNEFGCKDSSDVVVHVHPEPQVTVASASVCTGGSGTLTAAVSSGTAPFTYAWSTGANTASINVAQAGEYSVTVTDAAGCQSQASGTFAVHAPIVVAVASQAVCFGETGTFEAAITSGGRAPFTYAWNNGAKTQSISVGQAGEYSVTVTDANGCTGQASGTLTVRPALQVSVADVAVCDGVEGTLQASVVNGTAPLTYSWSTGATTASITVGTDGEYQVTVTDANGCTGQASARLTVRAPVVVSLGDVEICAGETTTLTPQVSGANGAVTYSWSTGASTGSIQATQAGEYTVIVRDTKGCEGQATATLRVHPQVEVSVAEQSVCFGETGTLRARVQVGTGPFQYAWSNGETGDRIQVSAAGEYCVTVTDAHGCTGRACATFAVRTALQVSVNDVAVCNGEKGTLQANVAVGTAPFSYSWSTGATTQSITVGAAGDYTVTVTDANGCAGQASAHLTVRAALEVTLGDVENCGGESITLSPQIRGATAPASCRWSTGATTPTIQVTQPGVYTVSVQDANGCEGTASATVTMHPLVQATIADQSICSGETATITARVQVGTGPFQYTWSNGQTGDRIRVTAAGSYWVDIIDANGCKGRAEATVTVFSKPTASVRDVEVCEGKAATLSVIANGGTKPYTYRWSTGETSPNITRSLPGEYCVTVTDANGCETDACGKILESGTPVCDIQGPVFACLDTTSVFSFHVPDAVPTASAGMPSLKQSPRTAVGEVRSAVFQESSSTEAALQALASQMLDLRAREPQERTSQGSVGKIGLTPPTSLQIEWSVSPSENAQIIGGANQPTFTVHFSHLGRFVVTLKLTTSTGCSSECSREVVVVDCDAPGCPRTVGFWGRQCAQSGNGDTKFTRSEMYRIVGCIDARSDALNLGSDRTGFDNFCTILNTDDTDQRHQAKRQFAGMLANVCVGNLGIVANNGEMIHLFERTRIYFPPFAAGTIGELIDEMDAILLALEPLNLKDPQVKSRYAEIIRVADAINNGQGIGITCTTGQPDAGTGRGAIPGESFKPTPNPTTGSTSIMYTTTGAAEQRVDIVVYDISGRQVRVLERGMRKPGSGIAVWDGRDDHGTRVASGVYYVRGVLGTQRHTSRVVLVRK